MRELWVVEMQLCDDMWSPQQVTFDADDTTAYAIKARMEASTIGITYRVVRYTPEGE